MDNLPPPPPSHSLSYLLSLPTSSWYGLIWFGMVCYSLVCFAMVCYGLLWFALVCYGLLWFAMVCYGLLLLLFNFSSPLLQLLRLLVLLKKGMRNNSGIPQNASKLFYYNVCFILILNFTWVSNKSTFNVEIFNLFKNFNFKSFQWNILYYNSSKSSNVYSLC